MRAPLWSLGQALTQDGRCHPRQGAQEACILKQGLCRRGQSGHLKGLAHLERHERIRWIQEAEATALGMSGHYESYEGLVPATA